METKVCGRCKLEKNIDNFRLKKTNGVYKRYYCCLECERELRIEYWNRPETKQKLHDYKQKYMKEHKEKISQKSKEYNARPEVKQRRKEYLLRNKNRIKETIRKYQDTNREKLNEHERNRRRNDSLYRFKNNIRKSIDRAFNFINAKKHIKTKEIVGLNAVDLRDYLLKTFINNYGYEWDGVEKVHIDHIKPLATAKTKEDLLELCHYTNLQLLKAEDNLKKGTKINYQLFKGGDAQ